MNGINTWLNKRLMSQDIIVKIIGLIKVILEVSYFTFYESCPLLR